MMKKNTSNKKIKPSYKKYILGFWGCVVTFVFAIILIFTLTTYNILGELPTFEELENPEKNFATEIITSDGKTLGKFYNENRTPIKYEDLPQNLINALISTEDERFHEHAGIDIKGTLRALSKLGTSGGASTITQQLAKLLFTKKSGTRNKFKRILQKIKEWIIAIRLERQYTKEEIITMYFNKFDFLYNAIGIRSASRIYFAKEPKNLKIEESAILIAMLKNPRQYNPQRKRSKQKSIKRRNQVFAQMNRNHFITSHEKDSLQKLPLVLDFSPESYQDGNGTYFREYLRKFMKKWLQNNPKENGQPYNLYKDGLKIYVTLDSRMQKYAEQAVSEHICKLQDHFFKEQKQNPTAPFYNLTPQQINAILSRNMKATQRYHTLIKQKKSPEEIDSLFKTKRKMKVFTWRGTGVKDTLLSPYDSIIYYKHFLHSSLLSMNPQTGHVKAWVGGINNKYFQYDHIKQGKRQVGSIFKPFVYASAIDQLHISPCDTFLNIPYTIPKDKYGLEEDWTPKNSGNYGGKITLKQALAHSVNVISARLIDKVSPEVVVRLAKKAGITSPILPYPSIALGSVEVSLYDMVTSYGMFANKGLMIRPMTLLKIEDRNGRILASFLPKRTLVLSEESAYVMLVLLKAVTSGGSATRLRGRLNHTLKAIATGYPYQFTNPIAGKTGTSQNHSDGWFMGMVPNLVTGVWTGADNRSIHFKSITKGQGATMSLPTWALYMKKCYADKTLKVSHKDFVRPKGLRIKLNCGQKKTKEAIDF